MAHLYATFADAALAEKAAGALLDFGVRKEDLSLVANEGHGAVRGTGGMTQADLGGTAGTLGNRAGHDTASVGDRLAQAGDRVAGAVTGAVGATGASANYAAAGTMREGMADTHANMAGAEANSGATVGSTAGNSGATVGDDSTSMSAKHGISTTTPEDAGEGAVKGTEIGLGLGILAAAAALLVPGVGLVIGGGALATALGGTALAAGAGAVAGGVTGYLKDQGVPGEAVQHYQTAVQNGGAILSVNIPSGNVDQAGAEQVLSKYGASNLNAY